MIGDKVKPEYSELMDYINHKLTIVHATPFYLTPTKPVEMNGRDLVKKDLGATQMSHQDEIYCYVLFKDGNEIAARVIKPFNREDMSLDDIIPLVLREAGEQCEINFIKANIRKKDLEILSHIPREIPSLKGK